MWRWGGWGWVKAVGEHKAGGLCEAEGGREARGEGAEEDGGQYVACHHKMSPVLHSKIYSDLK